MNTRKSIITAVIRQYGTGLYKACVSLEPNQSVCLNIYINEAEAEDTIERFKSAVVKGDINSMENVYNFIESIKPLQENQELAIAS